MARYMIPALALLTLAACHADPCHRGGAPTWNSTNRCQCVDESNNFYGELLKSEVCADQPFPSTVAPQAE